MKKENRSRISSERGAVDKKGREILLSLKNVEVAFGKGDKKVDAVKNVSFDIYKGEIFSLVGESGSGKTTIGRAIARINHCTEGEILYKGTKISGKIPKTLNKALVREIQMIFQDPSSSLNERATVDYIVSEGLYNFHLFEDEQDRVRKVEKMMEDVGLLPEHLTRYPHEFSGGQRQRIGIARAMVMEPELVIADEPISALDVSVRAQVLNLLKKFQRERQVTYLFIAHDLSVVRFISDRIGVIYDGKIVEIADAEELFNFPLHPYTRSLISAIPIPDPKLEKNKILVIYDPSVHDYSKESPDLVEIGHNHFVYGSSSEIERYKKIREKGVPIKSIFIADGSTDINKIRSNFEENSDFEENFAKISSLYDTKNKFYAVLSFFLPIFGVISSLIFKKISHNSAANACKKGAFAGFATLGAVLLILLVLILIAVI